MRICAYKALPFGIRLTVLYTYILLNGRYSYMHGSLSRLLESKIPESLALYASAINTLNKRLNSRGRKKNTSIFCRVEMILFRITSVRSPLNNYIWIWMRMLLFVHSIVLFCLTIFINKIQKNCYLYITTERERVYFLFAINIYFHFYEDSLRH